MEHAPNPIPPQEPQQPHTQPEAVKTASYGPMLGIVLIVAVLVIGAFYVWGQRLAEDQQPVMPENGVRGDTIPFEDESMMDEGSASVEASLEIE